ncbi:MAG: DUF2264 domain-containing protein [Bacteroidota bacterium]
MSKRFVFLLFFYSFICSPELFSQTPVKKDQSQKTITGAQDRKYWCDLLYKISYPVIHHLANSTLKAGMPLEQGPGYGLALKKVTYLEAVGRTAAGVAPWLSLPDDNSAESIMRKKLRNELLIGLKNAVDPTNPDYLNFRTESQPLVDAAFLAHAFLRAPQQLWRPLDTITKKRFVEEFQSLRSRQAGNNNWLLFPAMTETFLLTIGEQYDSSRIYEAIRKMDDWYAGDGWYSDGPHFAMDYYNSYVIYPMMADVLRVLAEKGMIATDKYELVIKRMVRYAELQERMISPEGTYPPIGRSLTYRIGAFQALAQASLMHKLPEYILPAQVRCGLTKVLRNQFEMKGTFDKNGWLQLGFAGSQPGMADTYTSTGSLYLCTVGFLALGLPGNDKFWTDPAADWTSKKAWSGQPFKKDYKVNY